MCLTTSLLYIPESGPGPGSPISLYVCLSVRPSVRMSWISYPGSGIRDLDPVMQDTDPRSRMRDLESQIPNPRPRVRVPESVLGVSPGIADLHVCLSVCPSVCFGSRIRYPGPGLQDPGLPTPDLRSGISNLGSRISALGSRICDRVSGWLEAVPGVAKPGSGISDPGFLGSGVPDPDSDSN